jgi:hypothetical protein
MANSNTRLARFFGLHLSDDRQQKSAARRRLMYKGQVVADEERVERMHLFWTLWTMDCCSILAWQRISAYDDQTDFPVAVNKVGAGDG